METFVRESQQRNTPISAPARTTTTSGFRLEFIDPRASAPRPLRRGRGIKIPLLRRSLLPDVDNGDSGARVIGGARIFRFPIQWLLALPNGCPKFPSRLFFEGSLPCFLSIIL